MRKEVDWNEVFQEAKKIKQQAYENAMIAMEQAFSHNTAEAFLKERKDKIVADHIFIHIPTK